MSPLEIKSDMLGYMLTVKHAQLISKIPVEVISVIPHSSGCLFLVRLLNHTLAQGMSGSPVYIGDRLIGAVRSGWEDSAHDLALVIPVSDMIRGVQNVALSDGLTLMRMAGLSAGNLSILELSHKLNTPIITNPPSKFCADYNPDTLLPGSSITVYLVWGDAELSALGTVTAVDKHGNFLAFGHEFLRRGSVKYPCGGAYIHDIVNTDKFPVKLSSSLGINGTVTSDTDSGIGGKFGKYAPSIPCEIDFVNLDTRQTRHYTFRTIADEYLSDELISSVSAGLCEDAYGRKGEGTLKLTLRIEGRNIPEGWTYKNIYYSDTDIITESFKDVKELLKAYLTQPYSETMPCGISLKAEVTQKPKVLLIEGITAPNTAKRGQSIDIAVKLHEYRKRTVTRNFTLKIPSDAQGVIELIVRGGGTQSFKQAGISGGWKSISSLGEMLTELNALDANNELIIELNADHISNFLNTLKSEQKDKKSTNEPDLLPEEEEYLSQTKERRKREGTLKIYNSEHYIDGLMRSIIHIEE